MYKDDPYSTHIEFLQTIISIVGVPKNAVEFGMGNYSTEFLLKNSEHLVSIEMQSEEWFNKIFEKFKDTKTWVPFKLLGPFNFTKIDFKHTDLVLIDGHGETRPECVNLMFNYNVPYIIAHDTEAGSYGWNRVKEPSDYFCYEFKKYENWSTLWTTNEMLFKKLLDKYS